MSLRMSRKRKASLRARAKEMNEAKLSKSPGTEITTELHEGPSIVTIPSDENLTEDLPAPIEEGNVSSDEEEDPCDDDYEGALTSEDTTAIYSDWISEMKRIEKQKVAMMLYDNFVRRMGLQKTAAASEVALFLGVSDKTVRLWRREFLSNDGEFSEDSRGKYVRYEVIFDEEYRDRALD